MTRADRLRLYNLDMLKVVWPDELADASRQARYAHCDEITAKQITEAANVNHTAKPVRKNTGGVGDVPASLEEASNG